MTCEECYIKDRCTNPWTKLLIEQLGLIDIEHVCHDFQRDPTNDDDFILTIAGI